MKTILTHKLIRIVTVILIAVTFLLYLSNFSALGAVLDTRKIVTFLAVLTVVLSIYILLKKKGLTSLVLLVVSAILSFYRSKKFSSSTMSKKLVLAMTAISFMERCIHQKR
ncbi:hypothetical protein [Portibacter marinus]|uniref:hypothetical protein n=1 Tax=Portibacter marinus TaxID=2898660 RepID=UPI001F3E2F55|nr:hypothetical protein [Portibacter marinus]